SLDPPSLGGSLEVHLFPGGFPRLRRGGYVGAIADGKYGPIALMLPAVAVFLAGVVYYPFVHMATTDLLPDAPPRSFAAEPDGRSAIQAHPLPESPPGGSSPAASDPLLRRRP